MSAVGTRLHRYIFRQLLVALLFAIGGILLVALPGIAVSTVHRMPFAGPDLLARYLPLVLKTLAPYVLPICFLLAVVATYGRLAADREWTAIQMSGAHPLGMFLPGLLLAALLGAGTYWMVSVDMPRSKVAQRMLVKDVARAALLQLKPGRTTLEFGRFYLRAAYRDKENQNILYKVHIRTPDKDMGHAVDIFAEKVELRLDADNLSIDLYEPQTSTVEKGLELGVENFTYTVPIEDLVGVRQNNYTHPAYMTSSAIREELGKGVDEEKRSTLLQFELDYRISMSAIYLIFLLVGAPTGILLRKGTQLGALTVAIGFGLVYYALSVQLGRDLGRGGHVPTWAAVGFVPAVGLLVSLPLVARTVKR
ncbi:MAG: LptF/LptG family permease [Planctomycetota bacterium]